MQTRKFGLVCALIAALVMPALIGFAQDVEGRAPQRQGGQRRGGGRISLAVIPVSGLEAPLNLTAEQKTKITQIQEKYRTDMQALRPQPGSVPDPTSSQKVSALNQQANKDIEAVLTAEQKAKLPEVRSELQLYFSVGIPLDALGELKLTDEQKKKITDIAQAMMEKVRQLPRDQRRQQMREVRQEARQSALATLTDEQKKIVESHSRQRRQGNRRNTPDA